MLILHYNLLKKFVGYCFSWRRKEVRLERIPLLGGVRGGFPHSPVTRIPPRIPPIRVRKSVPDCWIGLELVEGKNRQVRRMTAAIGHPTLRLLRVRIGGFRLEHLGAGQWKILDSAERTLVLSQVQPRS